MANDWVTITEEDEWETITEPRPKPTAIQKAGQAIKEAVAAPVRTIESMAGSMGGLMRMQVESVVMGSPMAKTLKGAAPALVIAEHLVRKYGPDRATSFYNRKMQKLADAGKKVTDFWEEQANKGWEAPNPDIVEARWRDRPVSKTVSAVSSGLTSIGVVLGTTALTGQPQLGLAVLAGSETGAMYDRLRDDGVSPDVASKLAQMAGAWTYGTEKIGFDRLLKPGAKTIMTALRKGGWEGAQEVVEQMGHNLLEYFGYDYRKPEDIPTAVKAAFDHIMDGWQDALVGGIGAGGLVHVALPSVRSGEPMIENVIEAASRIKTTGEIFTGENHGITGINALEKLTGRKISEDKTINEQITLGEMESIEQGFITDIGRFVSAQEAAGLIGAKGRLDAADLLNRPITTPPTVEELTKKPIEEIAPQTPDHAIGHQYGLTNEQVDNKLDQAELRYRELKLKKARPEMAEVKKAKPIRLTDESIIHPSARVKDKIQVTYFTKEGKPAGHDEYNTLQEALEENFDKIDHPVFRRFSRTENAMKWHGEALSNENIKPLREGKKYEYLSPLRPLSGVQIEGIFATVDNGTKSVLWRDTPMPLNKQEHLSLFPYSTAAINAAVADYIAEIQVQPPTEVKGVKDVRTSAERDELSFLSRNRTNIEAMLERETRPVTPPPIKRTQKNLLALGHKIAREAELTDEEYRDFAEIVTGKRSMSDMSKAERNEFVSALEESYGAPKELLPEDYDMPINVAGRATSMREVRNEAAKTTEALVDKKKVPATIKIGFGKVGAVQGLKNFFFGIDNTPPYHLARILDGGTEGIFSEVLDKGIEAGRKNSAAHTRSVMDALLAELGKADITDADLAKMSKAVNPRLQTHQMISKGAATEIFTIEVNGQNFEMTMANLIDIYLISNQEAGIRHLTKGGLVIEGVETGVLSEEQITDLRTRVEDNPKAKKIADTVLEIGELIWKPSINQVSQRLEGKEIATEPDWWGLEVYMPKRLAGKTRMGKLGQFGVNLIEDKGILKDRTRSTAPLVLRDALRRFSVFESAIAEYAGMAEASRTSRTLLNDPSIATALDQKGYNEVRKRILKIHEQAQSLPAFEGNMSAWFARRLPGLYRAVLFFNPRVVASQKTSTFNYGAYVSPKYMKNVVVGLKWENIQETLALSDVAWNRFHMGHSSLELGEATQSDAALRMWTGGRSSDINKAGWAMKIADISALTDGMKMAQEEYQDARKDTIEGFSAEWWLDKDVDSMPEADTDLWRKVQEEGENADPEERQAVEQWRKLVTDRAEYLWQRTQPSWDRWNRSTLTSQKGIRRLFLLFRSFHEKSLTIFNEAKMDYENSAKTLDDKTEFAQKTGSVLTGYTVNMFLRLAIMAALTRELKEPVKYFEEFLTSWTAMFPIFGKVLKTTVNRFVDTLAGAKPTYIGEAVESYPVRVVNMVLKSPTDMAQAAAHLLNGDNEEAEKAFECGIGRFAEGVGTLSGVPVPEIKRVLPKEGEEPEDRRGPARRAPAGRREPR